MRHFRSWVDYHWGVTRTTLASHGGNAFKVSLQIASRRAKSKEGDSTAVWRGCSRLGRLRGRRRRRRKGPDCPPMSRLRSPGWPPSAGTSRRRKRSGWEPLLSRQGEKALVFLSLKIKLCRNLKHFLAQGIPAPSHNFRVLVLPHPPSPSKRDDNSTSSPECHPGQS